MDDIGMAESSDGFGFGEEAVHGGLAAIGFTSDAFDSHLAIEPGIGGEQNFAHTTLAKRFFDFVTSSDIDNFDTIVDRITDDLTSEGGLVTQATGIEVLGARFRLALKRILITETFFEILGHDSKTTNPNKVGRLCRSERVRYRSRSPCQGREGSANVGPRGCRRSKSAGFLEGTQARRSDRYAGSLHE